MSTTTRKRAIRAVAPVAGLLAAGLLVWQGSYAAFSATTVNQDDTWATGELTLENNGGDGAWGFNTTVPLFDEADIAPGDSGTGCITVRRGETQGGDLRFFATNLSDSSGGDLGDQIELTVTQLSTPSSIPADCSGFSGGTTVLSGVALSALPADFAGSAATNILVADGGDPVVYKFDWTFQPGSNDNALQAQNVVVDFNWEMQS